MNRHRSNRAYTTRVRRRAQKRAAKHNQFAVNSERYQSAFKMALNQSNNAVVMADTLNRANLQMARSRASEHGKFFMPSIVLNRWQPEPVEKRVFEFPVREWRRTG